MLKIGYDCELKVWSFQLFLCLNFRLEKEYYALKTKEDEEQTEIRVR